MPKGVYPHKKHQGFKPGNTLGSLKKGIKFSVGARENMSRAQIGKILSDSHKRSLSVAFKGANNPFWGKKHSKRTILNMSLLKIGKPNNSNTKFKIGDKPKNTWKGGRTTYLRKQCLKRDNYTCKICGLYDPEIVCADHIKPKSQFPELSFNLDNLQTLCPNCHERKSRKEKGWHNKH